MDAVPGLAEKPGGQVGAMNSIARTALKALTRARGARGANTAGEIKGGGPAWACARYAGPGHDYVDCGLCHNNFRDYMKAKEAA